MTNHEHDVSCAFGNPQCSAFADPVKMQPTAFERLRASISARMWFGLALLFVWHFGIAAAAIYALISNALVVTVALCVFNYTSGLFSPRVAHWISMIGYKPLEKS